MIRVPITAGPMPGPTVRLDPRKVGHVLVERTASRRELSAIARRTLDALSEPIVVGSRAFRGSASIGIATYGEQTEDVESLLRNADVAMYLSKSRGKGRYEFFEPEMHAEAIDRLDLTADLQRAIDEGEFFLNYQPIFDLATGQVVLVEARDFAQGTSSRSTKLVHGGVRYLAQGNIGLVREALRERGRLRRDFVETLTNLLHHLQNIRRGGLTRPVLHRF